MRNPLWLLAVVPFAGLALAQEVDVNLPEFSQWFTSPHSLALVVIGLVAFIRKHFVTKLDGLAVPAVALVLSLALSLLGNQVGYLSGNWLIFGLQAGFEAVLAVSGFRSVVSSLSNPQAGQSSSGVVGGDASPPPTSVNSKDKAR